VALAGKVAPIRPKASAALEVDAARQPLTLDATQPVVAAAVVVVLAVRPAEVMTLDGDSD